LNFHKFPGFPLLVGIRDLGSPFFGPVESRNLVTRMASFPPGTPGDFSQQDIDPRQLAAARLGQSAFQQSWYMSFEAATKIQFNEDDYGRRRRYIF